MPRSIFNIAIAVMLSASSATIVSCVSHGDKNDVRSISEPDRLSAALSATEKKNQTVGKPDYEIIVEPDNATPTVTVRPLNADSTQAYMVNALSYKNIETLGFAPDNLANSITSWWQSQIDDSIVQMMNLYGYSLSEAIAVYCKKASTGTTSKHMLTLIGGLEHVVFVQQIDVETARLFGNVTMKEFTNGIPAPVDLDLSLTMTEITSSSAECVIRSKGRHPAYVAGLDYAAEYAGMSDKQILEKAGQPYNNNWISWSMYYGDSIISFHNLEPDTDYVIFAYYTLNGVSCSRLFKISFSTLLKR